jgi:predicted RNase H-like nuclease
MNPRHARSGGPDYQGALEYATITHAAQVRKGTDTPYIEHPKAVAELVLDHGGTETEAIAALLHDAVEDQGGRRRLDDIEQRFGPDVARIVAGCSDWIREPDQSASDEPSWCERKRAALAKIAAETDESILRVSLADKVHNASSIAADLRVGGQGVMSRFSAAPTDLLWYYRGLVGAFRERGPATLHRQLTDAVDEMERHMDRVPDRRPVVGVDAAPGGWVAVALDDDCLAQVDVYSNIRQVVRASEAAQIVAVDMPIGLEAGPRQVADREAKEYLGPHGARVFMTPPREALLQPTYSRALAYLRAASLPLVSAQAYALRKKILEVDKVVGRDDRVREVHPEVSFRAMNGEADLRHRKKTPWGFAERKNLLERNGVWLPETAFHMKRVGPDDVLDAGAAAWSARRIASGMGQTVPAEPGTDDQGRPIAIWY